MAKKETDLLRDPILAAASRYREQVDAFKAQYIPKRPNPMRTFLKNNGISMKDWKDTF